jgi:hypothetical protein
MRVLDTISGALKSRDADGRTPRLVTVAMGEASSAAATLLVLGHYSIAHPYSTIHFHGGRFSEINVMTMEDAAAYQDELSRLNRKNASIMSQRIIGRIVRRFVQLMPEIQGDKPGSKVSTGAFVDAIKERTSYTADRVIDRTLTKIKRAQNLYDKVWARAKRGVKRAEKSNNHIAAEVAILKGVIDCVVKSYSDVPAYRLDDDAMEEVSTTYSLIRDYRIGDHFQSMFSIIRSQAPALLSDEESAEYKAMPRENLNETVDWLYKKTGERLRWLWHFSVLLARELQSGENRFSAKDAYWVGCIDEVMGDKNMLGERADAEIELPPDPTPVV